MDENLVKGFKLKTGDVYKYDYESLGNKPFYNIITVGDVIISETTCYFEEDTYNCTTSFTVPSSVMQYPFENGKNYLLYIDDNAYIIYKSDAVNLNFFGLYDDIVLQRTSSESDEFVIETTLNIVGEHVVKLCSIASEDTKPVDIKNSIILKSIMSENGHPYFVTNKNLSYLDLAMAYINIRLGTDGFAMHAIATAELSDGTVVISVAGPLGEGVINLKYNPDSGFAIRILTDTYQNKLYNVYSTTPNLTTNDFMAATLYYNENEGK